MAGRITEKKSVKKKQKQHAKKNIFQRLGGFFKALHGELKKTSWANGKKVRRASVVTFSIVAVFVLVMFITDNIMFGLLKLIGFAGDPIDRGTEGVFGGHAPSVQVETPQQVEKDESKPSVTVTAPEKSDANQQDQTKQTTTK